MSENLNRKIKSLLESIDLKNLIKNDDLKFDLNNINHCCSNNSFLFIYLEEKSKLLAININKITKSSEPIEKSYQYLNLTAAPIGCVQKISINTNGTHILLVYDKSLSTIELPLKWGKFDEYEGGSKNIICKTIQFNLKNLIKIIDATFHTQPDDDYIVCLAKTSISQIIYFFSFINSNVAIKSFNLLQNTNQPLLSTQYEKSSLKTGNNTKFGLTASNAEDFISIDIGNRFEYNNRLAYPIFILKLNGQVNCLIEYENSVDFDYLGSLRLEPYCMDYDEEQQVISFLCVGSQPNCIVLLLKNGQIYNCLFMPTTSMNTEIFDSTSNFYDTANGESNSEATLFVYDIIEIDSNEINSNTVLMKDILDPFRYYIYHKAGVHSVFMPWLEEAKLTMSNLERFDSDDYNETKLSEISNLICTKPLEDSDDFSNIIGLTLINGYGARTMLLAITNDFKFISTFIYKSEQYDCGTHLGLNDSKLNSSNLSEIDPERFLNYIKGILKRDFTIPVIKTSNSSSTHKDNNEFILKVINSLKTEYLEKQKEAFNKICEKSKQLKEQNKIEEEKLKEITINIESIDNNRKLLSDKYEKINEKQIELIERYEKMSEKLQKKMTVLTDSEKNMKKELNNMSPLINKFEKKIKDSKSFLDAKESKFSVSKEKIDEKYRDDELKQIKDLINDENTKLKDLIQKVDKLKIAVKI